MTPTTQMDQFIQYWIDNHQESNQNKMKLLKFVKPSNYETATLTPHTSWKLGTLLL